MQSKICWQYTKIYRERQGVTGIKIQTEGQTERQTDNQPDSRRQRETLKTETKNSREKRTKTNRHRQT